MQHGRSGSWPLPSISEIILIGVLHVHSSTCRDPAVRVSARDGGPGARAPVKSDRGPAFFPCQGLGQGQAPEIACFRPKKTLGATPRNPGFLSGQTSPHCPIPWNPSPTPSYLGQRNQADGTGNKRRGVGQSETFSCDASNQTRRMFARFRPAHIQRYSRS